MLCKRIDEEVVEGSVKDEEVDEEGLESIYS
jgi:hypothetical protein